jgi:hypothetical protein
MVRLIERPNMTKATFPKLTKVYRQNFDLHLAAITLVARPNLSDLFVGGGMNNAPVIETPGKVGNSAWRTLHATECVTYEDESEREVKTDAAGSRAETLRAAIKKIAIAYKNATGEDYPALDAFKLTVDDFGNVQIWRTR